MLKLQHNDPETWVFLVGCNLIQMVIYIEMGVSSVLIIDAMCVVNMVAKH